MNRTDEVLSLSSEPPRALLLVLLSRWPHAQQLCYVCTCHSWAVQELSALVILGSQCPALILIHSSLHCQPPDTPPHPQSWNL